MHVQRRPYEHVRRQHEHSQDTGAHAGRRGRPLHGRERVCGDEQSDRGHHRHAGEPGAAPAERGRNHRPEDGGDRRLLYPARLFPVLHIAIRNVAG